MAKVYLLEGNALEPGMDALVEVRTTEPLTVRDGASFIIRTDNAKETLGGGRIVASLDRPIGRKNVSKHDRLRRWADALDDPRERLRFMLADRGALTPAQLARETQLSREAVATLLETMSGEGELVTLPGGSFTTRSAVDAASTALREAVRAMHKEQPLLEALPIATVRDRAQLDEAQLTAALAELGDEAVVEARTIRHRDHSVKLDGATDRAAKTVLACLEQARFAPPARDQVPDETGLTTKEAQSGFVYLKARGDLRDVAPGILYARSILDEGIRILAKISEGRGHFEPADAKRALGGISRKWLIPLLEYYDRIGATRRDGNGRRLTNKGQAMAEGGIDVG